MSSASTPTPAPTPAPAPTASSILQNLADTLGADALAGLKGVLGNTATNVENNPTAANATVQFTLLLPSLVGAAPGLETAAIQQAAKTINQLLGLIPTPTPTA